ncbi:MAG: hypothetical protein ACLUVC_01940 [Longibaculum sp.]
MQSNHNLPILIENYEEWLRVYYADGHYEILDENIREQVSEYVHLYKYKNPVIWQSALMHPTHNHSDCQCAWINLDYLEEKDNLFIRLLKQKELLSKAQTMYLKYKKEMFLKDG